MPPSLYHFQHCSNTIDNLKVEMDFLHGIFEHLIARSHSARNGTEYFKEWLTLPRNALIQKQILEKHLPMLEWQHPRLKIVCQLVRRAKTFSLMCRMPIFQEICDSSKNRVLPKEDNERASSNVGMVASKIKSCMPNDSSCRDVQFDVPHASISRNGRLFRESGSSKRRY